MSGYILFPGVDYDRWKDDFVEIEGQVKSYQNGVVASSMTDKGLAYTCNYGVSIVILRQIAKAYVGQTGLAEFLWNLDVREYRILATLIMNPASMDLVNCRSWIEHIQHAELAEQAAMNTFAEIKVGWEWMIPYFSEGSDYQLYTVIQTLRRMVMLDKAGWQDFAFAVFAQACPKAFQADSVLTVSIERCIANLFYRQSASFKCMMEEAAHRWGLSSPSQL